MSSSSLNYIFRNTLYNIGGHFLPLLVAIVSIPIFLKNLGLERFGILTLTWTIIGYFSVFDFGLGRATTKFVAEYVALNKHDKLPELVWTSLFMVSALGLVGGLGAFLAAPFFVTNYLNISKELVSEARQSLTLLTVSIPFIFSTSALSGILEAQQKFRLINAIRLPSSILSYLAPLFVFLFTKSLLPVISIIIIIRIIVCVAFFIIAFRSLPGLLLPKFPEYALIKQLLNFGSWLSVGNIISPIVVFSDRFLVASLLSMEVIAYYITPLDLLSKFQVIPGSLAMVLFSAFSFTKVIDFDKTLRIYTQCTKYLFIVLYPLLLGLIIFSKFILTIWIGSDFANNSSHILKILAIGVLFNSLAFIPYSAIQALDRPDLTAKLHIFELFVFPILFYFSIKYYGITGAALINVLRCLVHTPILSKFASNLLNQSNYSYLKLMGQFLLVVMATCIVIYSSNYFYNLTVHFVIYIIILGLLTLYIWKLLLDNDEKKNILSFVKLGN